MVRGRRAAIVGALALTAVLSGCDDGGGAGSGTDPFRPKDKPARFDTTLETASGALTARVETRSGEVVVTDLEGRARRLPLAEAQGRAASAASALPDGVTAQELIEAEFEAQRRPALPAGERPFDASAFYGARVVPLDLDRPAEGAGGRSRNAASGGPQLVEVTAEMKQGVDADSAFAYATCALASWAKRTGTPYARHVRTLTQGVDGRLRVASLFTVSRSEPMGLSVVEAGATLAECEARGIPAA